MFLPIISIASFLIAFLVLVCCLLYLMILHKDKSEEKVDHTSQLDVYSQDKIEQMLLHYKKEFHAKAEQLFDEQKHAFESILKEQADEFASLGKKVREDLLGSSSDEIKKLQDSYAQQLQGFQASLNTQVTTSSQAINSKVDEELEKIKVDLEAYKKQKMDSFSEKLLPLVQKITIDVIGQSIDPSIHKNLIQKAIEEAKTDQVFEKI